MNTTIIKKFKFLWLFFLCVSAHISGNIQSALAASEHKEYRIIGGVEAPLDAWPWVAAIVHAALPTNAGFFCSGSLIHPRWVLTAAHCLDLSDQTQEQKTYMNPEDIHVVLQINDLGAETGERIKVRRIIPHPDYAINGVPDIALIELETPSTARPMPIYSGSHNLEGILGTVLGWGSTTASGLNYANRLRQVDLPIISNQACSESMTRMRGFFYEINELEMCAGYPEGVKDSCKGDSGGPLLIQVGEQWHLAGIVSWGDGCASPGYYGVYTRVSRCIGFINTHLTPPISQLFHNPDDDGDCFISTSLNRSGRK